jgi:hypothetical protein
MKSCEVSIADCLTSNVCPAEAASIKFCIHKKVNRWTHVHNCFLWEKEYSIKFYHFFTSSTYWWAHDPEHNSNWLIPLDLPNLDICRVSKSVIIFISQTFLLINTHSHVWTCTLGVQMQWDMTFFRALT